ncbi:hypothetical protein HY485_04705 [Candidatus Woesearchaeota archaeon]|nr:hypothetical protein [Candidatus Woesearchaeota archaeon]
MINKGLLLIFLVCMLVFVGCSKTSLPYKSLSDAKLSSPTGHVVAVEKTVEPVVEESATAQPEASAPATGPSCHDSDYGKITTAAGKVKGVFDDGSEFEESDTCVGDVLYEYYCDGSKAEFAKEVCKRGCQNGFCI